MHFVSGVTGEPDVPVDAFMKRDSSTSGREQTAMATMFLYMDEE
jgi:hypothetical protein